MCTHVGIYDENKLKIKTHQGAHGPTFLGVPPAWWAITVPVVSGGFSSGFSAMWIEPLFSMGQTVQNLTWGLLYKMFRLYKISIYYREKSVCSFSL